MKHARCRMLTSVARIMLRRCLERWRYPVFARCRMRRTAIMLNCALLSTVGCSLLVSPSLPMAGTWFRFHALAPRPNALASERTSDCVFLLLPGFLDNANDFAARNFPNAIHRATGCDSIGVETNFRYYSASDLPDILYRDVVFPAERRGYQSIWLLGNSMGGMAAMMVAAQHAESVDGMVLMAPHIGYGDVLSAVHSAGGLSAWEPQHTSDVLLRSSWSDVNYTEHIWAWLKQYTSHALATPAMFLLWGDADEAREHYQLIATNLPAGRSAHHAGGHSWAAWTPLLETILPHVREVVDAQRRSRAPLDRPYPALSHIRISAGSPPILAPRPCPGVFTSVQFSNN